ncbi:Oidioi.mRNA.OKI2018_I69.chr2.g7105.t2.cds [Oikopleura dioica]|uniref:Histone-lysine N-methyltransferase, H3 lysine-79 specific n=1 Tax=Oikopleura dioica TaxID=34765 RepID=A0ABN7T9X2_OIKDI|nr:Oidioi.mRNA.OKI2018_I69.chr2.g7105.t2.cds [Oikopleura dioica]
MEFRPEEFAGKSVKLSSPVGQGHLEIWWPLSKDKEILGARVKELEETIEIVLNELPDYRTSLLLTKLQEFRAYRTFESALTLVRMFNKNITTHVKLNRGTQQFHALLKRPIKTQALDHVLKQVYRASVTDPTQLNKYQSFTSETYGETNFAQMDKIIQTIKWSEDDVFVDLGSGIGSLVMQVSAMTPVAKSVGIEIQPTPCQYAKNMDINFKKIMKWYGYEHRNYDLFNGDFIKNEYVNTRTEKQSSFNWKEEATVIFVNNYAFSEDLNLKLRRIFGDMNIGTQIISTKAFCPVDFKINDRNAGNDIGCFMRVHEMDSIADGFSWTNNVVQVYKHVIDHSALADYYASKTKKAQGSTNSASSSTKDRSSSSSPIDFEEAAKEQVKTEKTDKSQKRSLKQRPMKKQIKTTEKMEMQRSRENSPAAKRGPKTGSKRGRSSINFDSASREALEIFNTAQVKSYSKKTTKRTDKYLTLVEKERMSKDRACIKEFRHFDEQLLDRIALNEKNRINAIRSMLKEARSDRDRISNKYETNCEQHIREVKDRKRERASKIEAKVAQVNKGNLELLSEIKANRSVIHAMNDNQRVQNNVLPSPQQIAARPPVNSNAATPVAYETIIGNGAPKGVQPRPSIIMKPYQNQIREMEPYPTAVSQPQRAKPNPSPHSVPLSPHSTKSSPSSDMNQSRINGHHIQAQGHPRDSVGPPPEAISSVASHYPIHLQPNQPASLPPPQQTQLLPNGQTGSPPKNASKRRRSSDIDRPKVVITPTSHMSTSPQAKQILHQIPPYATGAQVLLPGAFPHLNGLTRGPRDPSSHDPKIYGGLGGIIPSSVPPTSEQQNSAAMRVGTLHSQSGMAIPAGHYPASMIGLLSQYPGLNLQHFGFPYGPRPGMQRGSASASATAHQGVIQQSPPIQNASSKKATPHK